MENRAGSIDLALSPDKTVTVRVLNPEGKAVCEAVLALDVAEALANDILDLVAEAELSSAKGGHPCDLRPN